MMDADADAAVAESQAIAEAIKPLLAGHHPVIQGAALADLLAIWLAGHPPEFRQTLLDAHIEAVRDLIPINVKIIRDHMKPEHKQ